MFGCEGGAEKSTVFLTYHIKKLWLDEDTSSSVQQLQNEQGSTLRKFLGNGRCETFCLQNAQADPLMTGSLQEKVPSESTLKSIFQGFLYHFHEPVNIQEH